MLAKHFTPPIMPSSKRIGSNCIQLRIDFEGKTESSCTCLTSPAALEKWRKLHYIQTIIMVYYCRVRGMGGEITLSSLITIALNI